jgi:hypothetical protein
MKNHIQYWLPRISSIIISYVVYIFMTESTLKLSDEKTFFAVFMGIALSIVILIAWIISNKPFNLLKNLPIKPKTLPALPKKLPIDLAPLNSVLKLSHFSIPNNYQFDRNIILGLLPLGFWFGLFWYFVMGGFLEDVTFPGFIFLSIVAGLPMVFSLYSWLNPNTGGILYIVLGIFYFLLSLNHVASIALIVITSFLFQTGILFIIENKPKPPPKLESKPDPKENPVTVPISNVPTPSALTTPPAAN